MYTKLFLNIAATASVLAPGPDWGTMPRMKSSALFVIGAALLGACTPQAADVRETRFIMGTLVEFTIHGADQALAQSAIADAAAEMQRIDAAFTLYGDHANAVKSLNAAAVNVPVRFPQEASDLLRLSLEISKQTQGAFTPAIGSLSLLWGFAAADPPSAPPAAYAIEAALTGVNDTYLHHDARGWRRLHTQTKLDFGAIAKGYAIDRAIAVLKAQGIQNAIVNAGGDLRAIGSRGKRPWRIGIRHPRQPQETLGWLEVSGDKSIVTSGDYERFFMYGKKRFHHIIDPKSGWPATASQSATVIADRAARADAWSTALFVLGADGLARVEAQGMQAILVDATGVPHITSGLAHRFHAGHGR